jgi:hypothetical protein
MLLDSLVSDSAWRAKYALDENGKPIPFEIIEEEIRATHPFAVFQLRAMLAVPYFEKALYELPEDQVTAENVMQLADKIEQDILGGCSALPLLSVPHLVSDEASCYYHGYHWLKCLFIRPVLSSRISMVTSWTILTSVQYLPKHTGRLATRNRFLNY